MDVQIETMAERRCFGLRHRGPYEQIPESFAKLDAIVRPLGLAERPGTELIAVYHDDPKTTSTADLRSDATISVAEGVPLPAGLTEVRLPAGRYAMTVHLGPYDRIGDTWARFRDQWLPASGERALEGPSYEIYRNTPAQVPKAELVTELYLPLA